MEQENAKLKKDIRELQQKLIEVDREIQIQQNNIEQYDKDKQLIMQKIRKLLVHKENKFEKKIKQIIERLPCQIEQQSLRNLTNSIIQKGIGVLNELNLAYKNPYNVDYKKCQENQSLFESFFIIGVKHKQFKDFSQQNRISLLKPKILYKQFKPNLTTIERTLWIDRSKQIKKYFENNLIVVERLFDHSEIENLIQRCLEEQNVLQENSFIFNIKSTEFDKEAPKNIELLTTLNNNKQLLVFVQGVDDYITTFQEDGFQYWKCKKYYCFITYFPIPQIFDQLLKFVTNLMQIQRKDAMRKHKELINGRKIRREITQQEEVYYNFKIFQDIDAVNINYIVEKNLQNSISLLLKENIDFDKPKINFNLKDCLQQELEISQKYLNYSLPIEQININNQEGFKTAKNQIIVNTMIKYAHVALQIFRVEEFFDIFQQILSEKQVVFFCPNINILTSVCYFFHKIIYPFIWLHPVIYYSNQETLDVLISETPMIIGINQRFYNDQKYQDLIKNNELMIIEIKVQKKRNCQIAVTSQLIQDNQNKFSLCIKTFNFFNVSSDIRGYKNQEFIFSSTFTQEQAEKCKVFLYKMIELIETELIKNVVPDANPLFIKNGWNQRLIKAQIASQQFDNKDFIMNCVFESSYFQTYLQEKYKANN
ncbi:unnamed protein product [Paramecium primaurelia]|uniref:cDENN domain-containing protein n=1 Tax=Paramecium primaurelia TaxID=5886 RepID=A0A8S1QGU9_PARPR|nr:unnamed protein product [Paramecium primaurelia]